MNIWMIQIGEPLPICKGVRKQRLSLLSEELASRGHQVMRWGSAFDHMTKKMISNECTIKISDNYTINVIKGVGYKKNISIARWNDHRILEKKLLVVAQNTADPDLIFVATPPHSLAYNIVRYAKKRNIPVIVDIRDQWPDIWVERLPGFLRGIGRLLLSYEYYKFNRTICEADCVTSMMEDLLDWGIGLAGRKKTVDDKVFYIGTPKAEIIKSDTLDYGMLEKIAKLKGKKVFTFIGTFGAFQHPLILVKVAKLLAEAKRTDIIFALAGDGDYFETVKKEALGLDNVVLFGWLKHEEIMSLLRVSRVGICPLTENRPFFPNKAFIYLSAFLPVIASTPGEFEGLIKKYEIGLFYKPGEILTLRNAVIELCNDEIYSKMRQNVEDSFEKLFDSSVIYKKFADLLEKIATR